MKMRVLKVERIYFLWTVLKYTYDLTTELFKSLENELVEMVRLIILFIL